MAKRSVTTNIVGKDYQDKPMLPVTDSIMGWGLNITKPLEYNYY